MTHMPFREVSMIFTPDDLEPIAIYLMPSVGDPSISYRRAGTGPMLKEVGELVATPSSVFAYPRLDITERERALLLGFALSAHTWAKDISTGWSEEQHLGRSPSVSAVTTVLVRADTEDHEAAPTPWPWSEDPAENATSAAVRRLTPIDRGASA